MKHSIRPNASQAALLLATALAALTPALTGCVPAAAVGVTTGVMMINDRRATETYIADEAI